MVADEVIGAGVEFIVAKEFEKRCVIGIGAGLGGDVDLSGFAAELRGIDAGLDLEFLNCVDGRQKDVEVEVDIGIGNSVESVVAPGGARACERHGQGRARPAFASGGLRRRAEADGHAGAQFDKAEETPAVKRQIGDALFLDDGADGGALGGQRFRARADFDGLRCLTHDEGEIHFGYLLHLQFDVGLDLRIEALCSGLYLVESGHQIGETVESRRIGRG